ncbi:MAG TPA: YfiR family protein [Bacteroidales bacterium]
MKKYLGIILIFLFLQVYFEGSLKAQTSISQAQAVFIYNFTRLIEWPADYKSGDFVIGVYGSSDLYNDLKSFTNGKMVGSQSITVAKFSVAQSISRCHILFVPFSKTKELSSILGILGGAKTLIITERKGALEEGAAINFVIVEDKLKFELKESNATKLGLKMHSNLESMAVAKY